MSNDPIAKALAVAGWQLIGLHVPRIVGCADAADLIGRKELLEQVARIIDPVIAEIMSEAAEHSNSIDRSYYKTILSDAFIDRGVLSALECAADEMREAEADAAERPLRARFNPDNRRVISVK